MTGVRSDFEQFAERELRGLLRYATMLTADPELARDLVQDVLLKAHAHWDRVSTADYPSLYVKAMLTRAHLSWRRRWSVRHVLLGFDPASPDVEVVDHGDAVVDRLVLWDQLATLPRQQRAVLVLRYYEQLTDAETADVLGCAEGTVRGYASRALATLRLQEAVELDPSEELS